MSRSEVWVCFAASVILQQHFDLEFMTFDEIHASLYGAAIVLLVHWVTGPLRRRDE